MRYICDIDGKRLYAKWNEAHNQLRLKLDRQDIAVYDTDVMNIMEDPIVFRNNTTANELSAEIRDKIQQLARSINIDELKADEEKYGNDTRDSIAKAVGIEKKKILSVTEIDLDEKVKDDEKETSNVSEAKQKEKYATTKDIKIKQEVNMNVMATSMKTIGGVLQKAGKMPKLEGKTFTKIGVVESDRIKNIDKNARINTTRFSLVAIATDGTVVPLNLEQDYAEGNNPTENSHRINADGRVELDDVNSRFRIGNNGETISIKFSNGIGNIEVGYSANKTLGGKGIQGNVSIDHQLQTSTVYWKPRRDSMIKEYGEGLYGTENRAKEAHIESAHNPSLKRSQKGIVDNSHEYKNIDGDMKTKEEEHFNEFIERARKLINENDDVANAFTENEVIKMLQNAHDDSNSLDEAEEVIKEDASRMHTNNR